MLLVMEAIPSLSEITRRIAEASEAEKIILFGSHACGDERPDSDLDLLVIIPGIEKPRAESTRLRRALRGLLVPVDIVVATPEQIDRLSDAPGLIYRTALTQGIVVYERGKD